MSTVQIGSILKNHEFRIRKIEKIQEEFENNRTQYVDNGRFNDLSDNVMTMKKMIESLDEYDKTFKEFRTSIKNIENNISFDDNYYTKTKIKADKLINEFKFLSLRVNFFGKSFKGKGTFTDWLFLKMRNKEKIFLFKDQYISGLTINTLSNIISKIINKKIFGIYKSFLSKNSFTFLLVSFDFFK